ncbi:E3 ubiquitin-protein ligase Fancl [Culicoides brevitarsis]|uniref:E3 ubiquitin-protein ligase Fancl n=1 Tax=Culicoides brevitarsis TaxID=469753 RepID=UPI00307BF2B4
MLQKFIEKEEKLIKDIRATREIIPRNPSQSLRIYRSHSSFTVKLEIHDSDENCLHFLVLQLDDVGIRYKIKRHSLPHGVLFNSLNTLSEYAEEFLRHIARLSYFMNGFRLLDLQATVVEPQHKSLSDKYRIFLLRERIFVKISFEPATASSYEDLKVKFIGPQEQIIDLEKNLKQENADGYSNLYQNLLKILEVDRFPENFLASEHKNCAICMEYLDENDKTPIYCCNNLMCDINFHHECILKWWLNLKTSNNFHDVVKGECPNCKTFLEVNKNCDI